MKNKSHVLLATDFYIPHWTGIVKGIASLVDLLKNEVDFTIITVRHQEALPELEHNGNQRIFRAKPFINLSRVSYSINAVVIFLKTIKTVETVIINSPCSNVLPFSIITKLFGKKLVIFHQGDLLLREGAFNRVLELIFFVCTWLSCLLANKVSSYSKDYAENSYVLKYFLGKFVRQLMPVEKPQFEDIDSKTKSQLLSLKTQGKIVFGFAGRFVHEKGFDILFKAIPNVLKNYPNAVFVFAGELNLSYERFFEEILEDYQKVKESVLILGLLQAVELWDFYSHIDFILIPSRSDCFNIVQAEACLVGAPTICSDIPGARVIARETGFGILAKVEDPSDLARKICEAITRKSELMKNHHKVLEFLDRDAIKTTAVALLCEAGDR